MHRLFDGFGIQEGDGRATVLAHAVVFQIDGGTALRAADLPNLGAQAPEFQLGEIADKLLFAQKLEERRETSIAARAPEIRELTGFAHVETQHQRIAATRAALPRRWRLRRLITVGVDLLEQRDDGAGCKLDAFEVIEPDTRTCKAQIEL